MTSANIVCGLAADIVVSADVSIVGVTWVVVSDAVEIELSFFGYWPTDPL